MTIFSASGVNVSVALGENNEERLLVDRGVVHLYENGTFQVVDRENHLACSFAMQTLTHMSQKIVRSQGGSIEKGRTHLFFNPTTKVTVGRFQAQTIVLRMSKDNHNDFHAICRRSGVPYE